MPSKTPSGFLNTYDELEDPGRGSKIVPGDGFNSNPIVLDSAVFGAHNLDGSHQAAVIDGINLKSTVADGSTIEQDSSSHKLKIKLLGIVAGLLAPGCITAGKILGTGTGKAVDNLSIGLNANSELELKEGGITSLMLGYREYRALLTQLGENAPVPVILNNTLAGTPVWYYGHTGVYYMYMSGAFPANRTEILIGPSGGLGHVFAWRPDADIIGIHTTNLSGVDTNQIMQLETSFAVRVYF